MLVSEGRLTLSPGVAPPSSLPYRTLLPLLLTFHSTPTCHNTISAGFQTSYVTLTPTSRLASTHACLCARLPGSAYDLSDDAYADRGEDDDEFSYPPSCADICWWGCCGRECAPRRYYYGGGYDVIWVGTDSLTHAISRLTIKH